MDHQLQVQLYGSGAVGMMGHETDTRSSSGGSFPLTNPRIFCRSGGTFVRLNNAAFKSKTLSISMECHPEFQPTV